ncbi:MAG: hypothetical protein AAFQ82_17695, partial [Myxococcota bacterium]
QREALPMILRTALRDPVSYNHRVAVEQSIDMPSYIAAPLLRTALPRLSDDSAVLSVLVTNDRCSSSIRTCALVALGQLGEPKTATLLQHALENSHLAEAPVLRRALRQLKRQ